MKNQTITIVFMLFITGIFALNLILKDIDISLSERRRLAAFPAIDLSSFMEGKWMSDFEKYALDQIPFRETFRQIKGNLDFHVFQKKDVNDIFVYEDHLIKLEYPYSAQSIESFNHYIKQVSDKYLGQSTVYLAIIPDKAFFVPDNKYPSLDYELLEQSVVDSLIEIKYINLFEHLTLEDYYFTDTHWKQENLIKIANVLGANMGFDGAVLEEDYVMHTYQDFKGVYYSQSALSQSALSKSALSNSALKGMDDDLVYLVSEDMQGMRVKNYEHLENEMVGLYDIDQLDSMDPYNVFLSGASPLIEIKNPNNTTRKELIVFRDSFGSSLVPLLMKEYSKVTLIDTRYMSYRNLGEYVEFANKDVLFLYNTAVINQSQMLR